MMNHYVSTVKANSIVDEGIHVIELEVPGFDGIAEAGQFVMVQPEHGYDPFLRRPYSIFGCRKEALDLLVKIVGKGSGSIAHKPVGCELEFFGPLGKGFPAAKRGSHLLVAGGMGIVPLWFFAHELEESANEYSLIFGERTHTGMGSMVEEKFPHAHLATDDGSHGFKGSAVDALVSLISENEKDEMTVYGCGPVPMLEQLATIAEEKGIPGFVSLEERMACGVGVCLGCSVKKEDGSGYVTVCRDGPVFPLEQVL